MTTGWIVWLQKSDLDAFILEVAQLLGEVDGGVVGCCVPIVNHQSLFSCRNDPGLLNGSSEIK